MESDFAVRSRRMLLGTRLIPVGSESDTDDPFLSFSLAILVSAGIPWEHFSSKAQRKP